MVTVLLAVGVALLLVALWPWGPKHKGAPPKIPLKAIPRLTKSNSTFMYVA